MCQRALLPLVGEWGLAPTAGTVFEDTTIALHLILRQLPHQYPNLKFVIPHLGGCVADAVEPLDNQLPMTATGPMRAAQPDCTQILLRHRGSRLAGRIAVRGGRLR